MIPLQLHNETAPLDMVLLGIATDLGTREKSINPKANRHLEEGTYPLDEDILKELAEFENILIENEVKVLRPQNIKDAYQIFVRDVGFVIGDVFFVSRMSPGRGQKEIQGIQYILDLMAKENVVAFAAFPSDVSIEGGDIVLFGDKVFVGKSKRTNDAAFQFLKQNFEKRLNKEFIQVPVNASENFEENVLHLDCAFQPIGTHSAIIYEEGILNLAEFKSHLSGFNLIPVSKKQAYRMFPNILSLSPETIVIEKRFFELKHKLLELNKSGRENFKIIEVNFAETSKLSGLLRCTTLPLIRK